MQLELYQRKDSLIWCTITAELNNQSFANCCTDSTLKA